MDTKLFIRKVLTASPQELSEVLNELNSETFQENNWDIIVVKTVYKRLIKDVEDAYKDCQIMKNFGNYTPFVWDDKEHEGYHYNVDDGMGNLDIARDFLNNPPLVENPKNQISVDISTINWDKPVYTTQEVMQLLDVSENVLRGWIKNRWISYTQVEGSDKKFILKENLMKFLNNPRIFFPSTQ